MFNWVSVYSFEHNLFFIKTQIMSLKNSFSVYVTTLVDENGFLFRF